MNEHYPKIRPRARNGALLLREGLSFCFYMRRDHTEIAQAVQSSLGRFLNATGPRALGLYADMEGDWQELDAAGWELTWKRLLHGHSPILQLRDASSKELYRFEYYGKPAHHPTLGDVPGAVCAVRFQLPTEDLEQHGPEWVKALALELAAPLPFCSGHAGLSFNGDLDVSDVMPEVHQRCFRYPGLDILELSQVSWEIGTRVRGPAWLTFLGQPALDGLGGASGLRDQLRAPCTNVEELRAGRAIISLGLWPEAGDTEQGNTLPAYRELARVLEPWLYHQERGLSGFTPEELHRWERRFLD